MILEWFQLSPVDLILLAILLLVFFVQLFFYLRYYRTASRKVRSVSKGKTGLGTETPPVSIIICARDQQEALEQNLPEILEQDYPEFQVVVVNDASSDDTEDMLIRLERKYPHLYHTFVPPGVENVSAKKMAMNIGIKAAKYDYLLLTEANCVPVGKQWISSMMRHFEPTCDIVLGFGSYSGGKGFLKRLVNYDTLFTALQFMGFAEAGKPYMGYGRNLAYRKELFFKNRGFASHLSLTSGEDDLFVGEIANDHNTCIEVSAESKILAKTADIWNHWIDQKRSRLVTSSYYGFGIKFRTCIELSSRLLFYALFVVVLTLGILKLNIPMMALSGFLFFLRYGIQLSVLNAGAKCFDESRYYVTLPLFDILLPVLNFWYRLTRLFHKDNAHTWRVLK